MRRRKNMAGARVCACVLIAAAACAETNDGDPSPDDGSSAGSGASGGSASVASNGSGPSGSGGGSSGSGGDPGPEPLADVGSLVVLGDSIGDGGGQGPFYYNLLHDALNTHYAKQLDYRNRADSGSTTDALLGQVNGLPGTLPGPVAVAITSGGNDMKDNLVSILLGSDGPAREQMGSNISAALDALLAPGRFGAGVEVHVYYANIYDASDGQGNFQSGGCVINMDSPSSTDPFFASWNGEIAEQVNGHGQVLSDMHGHFYSHGFNHPPDWYASDCTHPNTTGHAELKNLFYSLITGS